MHVIVTRPEPDGTRLAARLESAGYSPLLCPLMRIAYDRAAVMPAADYQALLVTSANGLRALDALTSLEPWLSVPVIAVGPASARLARSLGFRDVRQAAGDVAAVSDLVRTSLDPVAGPLLYITGKARAGDLKGDLEACGFSVERAELYDALPATALPQDVTRAIRDATVGAVLLYSPRTARIWAQLVEKEQLDTALADLVHICLSQAVADAVAQQLGDNLIFAVASSPGDDAMLEQLAIFAVPDSTQD